MAGPPAADDLRSPPSGPSKRTLRWGTRRSGGQHDHQAAGSAAGTPTTRGGGQPAGDSGTGSSCDAPAVLLARLPGQPCGTPAIHWSTAAPASPFRVYYAACLQFRPDRASPLVAALSYVQNS